MRDDVMIAYPVQSSDRYSVDRLIMLVKSSKLVSSLDNVIELSSAF